MEQTNGIHEIIELVRENEQLKRGISDIVINLTIKNGGERDTAKQYNDEISYILSRVQELRKLEK